MTILESANLDLKLWFEIYRAHNTLKMYEDEVYREYKLTLEQYVMLVTIKHFDRPVRPSDVAHWLRRSPNSISMLVDRMVKAGLLRRIRDRKDRRVVWLIITKKGEEMLGPAFRAGLEFIWKSLSRLSYKDKQTFLKLLMTVQFEVAAYLNPEARIEETKQDEVKRLDRFAERQILAYCPQLAKPDISPAEAERLVKGCCPRLHEAEYQGNQKGETVQ